TFPMFIIPTRVMASHTQNTPDIVAATVFCRPCILPPAAKKHPQAMMPAGTARFAMGPSLTQAAIKIPMLSASAISMSIRSTLLRGERSENGPLAHASVMGRSRCSTALRHSLCPASRPLPDTCSDVREDCGEAECRPHGRDGWSRCQAGGAAPGERSGPWTTAYGLPPRSVLDLGCGTGIVAVVLARLLAPEVTVGASDLSAAAVRLTRHNARNNRVLIDCRRGSLFEPWAGERFDLIVDDVSGVAEPVARVSGWYPAPVPSQAGDDGTRWILEVLARASDYLAQGGRLVFPVLTLSRA